MSLYDDLDLKEAQGSSKVTKASVVPGWSTGHKLLASTLQAKKASVLQPKRQRASQLAPVVDLKRHYDGDAPLQFNMQTGKLEKIAPPVIQPQASIAVSPVTPGLTPALHGPPPPQPFALTEPSMPSITGVADEYDPFRPNEYDDVVKKMKAEKEKEKERERRREDRRDRDRGREDRRDDRRDDRDRRRDSRGDRRGGDNEDSEMERMRKMRAEDDEEEEIDRSRRSGGAAIAPPTALLEEPPVNPDEPKSPTHGAMGMAMMGSAAAKIMAKYGYKKGQGLGKSEQGMSTALYVEKTSKRGGKIIHEKDIPTEPPPTEQQQTNTNLLKNPSKVIMLQNMVGPGEVDEELEPETAEECSKYGKVNKCVIFEIPGAPEDECVRIFVEFERMESAIKGLVDLNGRFFGGKVVKACFYNLDKFRRMDYSSPVE